MIVGLCSNPLLQCTRLLPAMVCQSTDSTCSVWMLHQTTFEMPCLAVCRFVQQPISAVHPFTADNNPQSPRTQTRIALCRIALCRTALCQIALCRIALCRKYSPCAASLSVAMCSNSIAACPSAANKIVSMMVSVTPQNPSCTMYIAF